MKTVQVLVDYDNISNRHKRRGIPSVFERILNAVIAASGSVPNRLMCRLYGGWYDQSSPTPLAQRLAGEILADFPRIVNISHPTDGTTLRVQVMAELAYSLIAEPSQHLLRTVRRRPFRTRLDVDNTIVNNCSIQNCSVTALAAFFRHGKCPTQGCNLPQESFLSKREQKLIDTMITSDLILMASRKDEVFVVSSDEDMWPGIKTALSLGAGITQVHTKSNAARNPYNTSPNASFNEVFI